MSNQLSITIGEFIPLRTGETYVVMIASDSYGSLVESYDDIEQFLEAYPSEKVLVSSIIGHVTFGGGAHVKHDGTVELDCFSSIEVIGYPS